MESVGFGIIFKRIQVKGKAIRMAGLCALKLKTGKGAPDMSRLEFRFRGEEETVIRSSFSGSGGFPFVMGYRLYPFSMEISFEDALVLDIQNKLELFYDGERICGVNYNLRERRRGVHRNTRVIRAGEKVLYFRQSASNRMWFVVRPENFYDQPGQRPRVFLAWLLAKLMPASDHVLMYEKEASRYEESASVLFEGLIDRGYDNVYYIINPDNPVIPTLKPAYRQKLVMKNSFRHLLLFFRCRTFIGTETLDHSLQLRAANRRIMEKTRRKDLTYVFLQHGVMYMVSLDAELRVGFTSQEYKKYRIVVSSEAEAIHFLTLAGYRREELYVTGLAKFDRSYREEDSDLIMIMPTWRRWETNLAETDFAATGYYRMLEDMVAAVPPQERDRIVIMPHPLMKEMMEREQTQLSRYLRPELTHDQVLRRCRVLITDYSSIAYDAFYRGANVVFYWKDKEECMKHYGGAHLMINEYNVFGYVCYDREQMAAALHRGDRMEQDPEHMRKYSRLVAFHDNRNTQRIIRKLVEDEIIDLPGKENRI